MVQNPSPSERGDKAAWDLRCTIQQIGPPVPPPHFPPSLPLFSISLHTSSSSCVSTTRHRDEDIELLPVSLVGGGGACHVSAVWLQWRLPLSLRTPSPPLLPSSLRLSSFLTPLSHSCHDMIALRSPQVSADVDSLMRVSSRAEMEWRERSE